MIRLYANCGEQIQVPDRLAGVMHLAVLSQHHLGLVLQVLHLIWVLQTTGLCQKRKKRVCFKGA